MTIPVPFRPALAVALMAALTVASAQQPAAVPEGVKAHRDLAYVENGHARQKLDLFVPEKAAAPLPLIIWVHGGGWAAGSKDGCPPLRGGYTERGYAVASIGYRLSGDAIFPAQIEDCKAAIRWLRAHAKQYGLDPQRFAAWGSSAGGHLAALLGTSGDVKEFDTGAHLDQSSGVQAVGDYYGPTDLLQMDAHALPEARLKHDPATSPESRLIGGAIQENKVKTARANPITYVSKNDPPFLIVHGDQDPTVPHHQSQLLYDALKSAGVRVRFHTLEGAGHGTGFGGTELATMVRDFFDRHLKGAAAAKDEPLASATRGPGIAAPADARPAPPTPGGGRAPGFSWEQVRTREGVTDDGRIPRDKFQGPPPLFDRLDRNRDGALTKDDFEGGTTEPKASPDASAPPKSASADKSKPPAQSAVPAPATPHKWESVSVTAPDDTAVAFLWTAPAGDGPFPVVMFVHGAPGGIGEEGLRKFAGSSRWSRFVGAGYAVCLADYRGHPEGQPFAVLKGEVNVTDDLAAIIRRLGALPRLDLTRLAVIGGSLGGVSTLEAVSRGKIKPACIVLNAPATFPFLGFRGQRNPDAKPDRDLSDAEIDKDAALARIKTIDVPTLIVQGTADGITALSKKLHELMKASGKDVRLELFPGQSHSFTNGPEGDDYHRALELTLQFIQKHTGGAKN